MREILQNCIPYDVGEGSKLPGIAPFDMSEWLVADDVFSQQMMERGWLLDNLGDEVVALTPPGTDAASELLLFVMNWLHKFGRGYQFTVDGVVRPDGHVVTIDEKKPLRSLAHLVQEDFCILQKCKDEHVLVGAVLCFPASWRLKEKIGRPLIGIHQPVDEYDDKLARRVQRLFDGVQVGRPMWRFNLLRYQEAVLYQPRPALEPRQTESDEPFPYTRSERQCILRLPETEAVIFSIHTHVVKRGNEAAIR